MAVNRQSIQLARENWGMEHPIIHDVWQRSWKATCVKEGIWYTRPMFFRLPANLSTPFFFLRKVCWDHLGVLVVWCHLWGLMFQDKSQVVALSPSRLFFHWKKVSEAKICTQTCLAHRDPITGVVFFSIFGSRVSPGLPRTWEERRGDPGPPSSSHVGIFAAGWGAPKATLRLHTKSFIQPFKRFPCFLKGISSSKRQQVGEINSLIKPDSSIHSDRWIYHSSSLPFSHCFTAWPRICTLTVLFWRFVLCLQVRPTASQTVFPWNLEAWRLSSLADSTPRNSGCILSSCDTNWFNVARGSVYLNYL